MHLDGGFNYHYRAHDDRNKEGGDRQVLERLTEGIASGRGRSGGADGKHWKRQKEQLSVEEQAKRRAFRDAVRGIGSTVNLKQLQRHRNKYSSVE